MALVISEAYRALQAEMHKDAAYGVAAMHYAPLVAALIEDECATEILDYGCGKRRLNGALSPIIKRPLTVHSYDPAIPAYDGVPEPCDLVVCIDVLEHIEPECIDAVLDDLARVTRRTGFFTISTRPAQKSLPDGRNTHILQRPDSWWLMRLAERFTIGVVRDHGSGSFSVIVQPKGGDLRGEEKRERQGQG